MSGWLKVGSAGAVDRWSKSTVLHRTEKDRWEECSCFRTANYGRASLSRRQAIIFDLLFVEGKCWVRLSRNHVSNLFRWLREDQGTYSQLIPKWNWGEAARRRQGFAPVTIAERSNSDGFGFLETHDWAAFLSTGHSPRLQRREGQRLRSIIESHFSTSFGVCTPSRCLSTRCSAWDYINEQWWCSSSCLKVVCLQSLFGSIRTASGTNSDWKFPYW